MAKAGANRVSFGTHLRVCDVCERQSQKSEAISYCETCSDHLCVTCDKAHKGSRTSSDHNILLWSKQPAIPKRKKPSVPSMLCEIHTTMLLNTFCKDHDDVICGNCKITNHRDCDTANIREHTSKVDDTFSKTIKNLVRLKYKYEDLKEMRQADRSTLSRKIDKCLQDIRMVRHELNSVLDKLEEHVIAEVMEYEDKVSKEIADHVNIADDMLVQINNQIKTMKSFQKTRDDEVMFVGMTKTILQVRKYDKVITDINKEICTIDIQFEPGEVVSDMIEQLQSIGTTIRPSQPYEKGQSSLLNISILDKQTVDIGVRDVRGCTFMPDGHFVMACFTDGVKLFDKNFHFEDELYVPSADVAPYTDTAVIVTQRNLKQLQILQILPKLTVVRKLKIDRICCGVDVYGDEIYVTCHDNPGNGEVQILNRTGKLKRKLGLVNGKYMFTRPLSVKLSHDGSKIFVSDSDTNMITCLGQHGHVIYRYSDQELVRPTGLYVDAVDNLLVCAWKSNNVHVIRKNGKKHMVVLTQEDEIKSPLCVAYRQSNGLLVVGLDNRANTNKALIVVKTQ